MGNLLSSPSNDETRRSNRLSKPPTQKLTVNTSSSQESKPPELVTGLIGWENPWVGSKISEASSGTPKSCAKVREIPPTLFESEAPARDAGGAYDPAVFAQRFEKHPFGICPEYQAVSPVNRRGSYHPGTVGDSSSFPQLSPVTEQPRRAHSLQASPLQRPRSVIYESAIEEATSSNTHFLVGNQRFSLTRRRSLLTRPGVATRCSTSAIRRVPSPIGEPENPMDGSADAHVLQWPLPPRQRPSLAIPPPARPSSPADSRYTQLGALKLGSLRVVNGSPPCPSERIHLSGSHETSAGLKLQNVIPSWHDVKQADDTPGSPFSFEKSPIISVQPRSKAILPEEPEDEGVGICDDAKTSSSSNSQPDKPSVDTTMDRRTSQSLNKSDSGYSSATSISSFQQNRTRASFDSQQSGSRGADQERNSWAVIDPNFGQPVNKVQRHLSLPETKRGYDAQLRPAAPLWPESSSPARQSPGSLRTRRATFCAGPYVENPIRHDLSPDVFVPHHTVPSRASACADGLPPSRVHVGYDPRHPSTSRGIPVDHPQMMSPETANRLHRSASEHWTRAAYSPSAGSNSRARSRNRRVWSLKPGTNIPPLPTILSPDHLQAEENKDLDGFESSRGRPRSRSHDRRRRKLTKSRPTSLIWH